MSQKVRPAPVPGVLSKPSSRVRKLDQRPCQAKSHQVSSPFAKNWTSACAEPCLAKNPVAESESWTSVLAKLSLVKCQALYIELSKTVEPAPVPRHVLPELSSRVRKLDQGLCLAISCQVSRPVAGSESWTSACVQVCLAEAQ